MLPILDEKCMVSLGIASILHQSNMVHMGVMPSMAPEPTAHTALHVMETSPLEVILDASHVMTGLSWNGPLGLHI
jgi:hypothetical protein